jgi:hypothetical protein
MQPGPIYKALQLITSTEEKTISHNKKQFSFFAMKNKKQEYEGKGEYYTVAEKGVEKVTYIFYDKNDKRLGTYSIFSGTIKGYSEYQEKLNDEQKALFNQMIENITFK